MAVTRSEVYLATLDPARGHEIRKTRPCVVVSPDEMNRNLATVVVAPMTTKGRLYPSRVACRLDGKPRLVVLDQLRTLDTSRLAKRVGRLSPTTMSSVLARLQEMFAP